MIDLDVHLPAIQSGDPDAFGRWVAAAEPTLRETLRSFAAVLDAEAVLQEALLRVWQVAPRTVPDGKPNSLFRLGVRIARNLAVSELRRFRTVALDETTEEPSPELRPDPILRARIEECRSKLPGKPAQALTARLMTGGGESDEALAAQLQMRLNTFLQNFTRARKLLAECLEAHGIDLDAELA
jgi:RNA polymerase sigma-70 factor (ECF subfamily)